MKVRLFLVLALTAVFALSAFSGGGSGTKAKAKTDSKSCCTDQAKATKVNDEHCKDMKTASASQCTSQKASVQKASDKMDCCKKDMKEVKADNATKKSSDKEKNIVKLAKDSK